jgi:hypothetical protein
MAGADDERRRSGGNQIWVGVIAGAAIALLAAVLVMPGLRESIISGGARPTDTPAPTATPVPTPTLVVLTEAGVLRRIETQSVLQTTVYRVDTVVRVKERDDVIIWVIPVSGQRLLFFVQGSVTAGVDLGELQLDNIDVSDEQKLITITLPPAKLLDATLDSYQIETYDGKPAEKVDVEAIQEGLMNGQNQVSATACENDILSRASEDAVRAVQGMYDLTSIDGYRIVVKAQEPAPCSITVTVRATPQPIP